MPISGLEFFLLFLGFIFIVVSLFLVDGKKNQERKMTTDINEILPEDEIKKITKKVNDKIEDITTNYVLDTDDKLSSITNEKIIAINDYTDQLFVKLDNNHQEVIFLYNMLQEKEEEMKSTLNRMEVVRKENQAFIDKITELRNKKLKSENSKRADSSSLKKETAVVSDKDKQINIPSSKEETQVNESSANEITIVNEETENKNIRILQLYKEKKSMIEISKILGIGQGEVKLVIDLYGKGSI